MRPQSPQHHDSLTFQRWRQDMLDETSRFIEWGLKHPDLVRRIPTVIVGKETFSTRVKAWFWALAFRDDYPVT